MAFHEVRFPDNISRGARGGPERRTQIVELASGDEERNASWANSRRRYDVAYGIRRADDLAAVVAFFEARNGRLHRRDDEGRSESYADILRRAGKKQIVADGTGTADPARDAYSLHAHGAVFAEVKVDPDFGQIRATRLVGAFAAGRIINPRMVDSQYYGGMIWGVSFALHEQALVDQRTGRIMNTDLAEYHIPVNADVPSLECIQVPEQDSIVNPLGIKGVGEIGVTGTAGAIANAVWHATGVRPKQFPIGIDTLLSAGRNAIR